jgi:broad specificity phosphatase PhoE
VSDVRIVLVRHGKPDAVSAASIAGHDIGRWVRGYDAAGISRELAPSAVIREMAASAGCVLASSARRAQESAAWLAASKAVRVDSELREAALPESIASSIRLSPGVWVVLARVAWWLNWCDSVEPIAMTRQRAGRVADRLAALAVEHGSVMAIGHGMFNRFVASQLRRRGWRGPAMLPRPYWTASQFEADARRAGGA